MVLKYSLTTVTHIIFPVDLINSLIVFCVVLQVLHKRIPCSKEEQSLFLTAVENTWIHGRQKRRERSRQLRELPRAPHCTGTSSQTTVATAPATTPATHDQSASTQDGNTQGDSAEDKNVSAGERAGQPVEQVGNGALSNEASKAATHSETGEQKEVLEIVSAEDVDMEAGQETVPKEAPAAASEPPSKQPLSPGAVERFLFKCLLNVMLEERDVVIEMHWVEGQNKDLMNQLCTYLKNSLLKSVAKS